MNNITYYDEEQNIETGTPLLNLPVKNESYNISNPNIKYDFEFVIQNIGTGTLYGEIQTNVSWLQIKNPKIRTGSRMVKHFEIDPANLENDDSEGNFIIKTNGGNEIFSVCVSKFTGKPRLSLPVKEQSQYISGPKLFIQNIETGTPLLNLPVKNESYNISDPNIKYDFEFVIQNIGTGTLYGEIQTNVSWLQIKNPKIRTGSRMVKHFEIDPANLENDDSEGNFIIKTNGGNEIFSVCVSKNELPCLDFDPEGQFYQTRKKAEYAEKNEEYVEKVVGVTYNNRQKTIKQMNEGDRVILYREPENIYDSNAIQVLTDSNDQIGYINKYRAKVIAPLLDKIGGTIYGNVEKITRGYTSESFYGVKIRFKLIKL